MSAPIITNHPLIQHKLTLIRDKNTPSKDFKQLLAAGWPLFRCAYRAAIQHGQQIRIEHETQPPDAYSCGTISSSRNSSNSF